MLVSWCEDNCDVFRERRGGWGEVESDSRWDMSPRLAYRYSVGEADIPQRWKWLRFGGELLLKARLTEMSVLVKALCSSSHKLNHGSRDPRPDINSLWSQSLPAMASTKSLCHFKLSPNMQNLQTANDAFNTASPSRYWICDMSVRCVSQCDLLPIYFLLKAMKKIARRHFSCRPDSGQ